MPIIPDGNRGNFGSVRKLVFKLKLRKEKKELLRYFT